MVDFGDMVGGEGQDVRKGLVESFALLQASMAEGRPDDPRFTWGERCFMLRHDPENSRWFKIGYRNTEAWGAYFYGNCMFLKYAPEIPGKTYPDYGSTFETYADADFVELESLGSLEKIEPGEAAVHDETWFLIPNVAMPIDEADVHERIEPVVKKILGK